MLIQTQANRHANDINHNDNDSQHHHHHHHHYNTITAASDIDEELLPVLPPQVHDTKTTTKTPYVFSKYTFSTTTKSPTTTTHRTSWSNNNNNNGNREEDNSNALHYNNQQHNQHQQHQQQQHQQQYGYGFDGGDGGADPSGGYDNPAPTTTTTRKPKATYHPVFDVYFNRIAQATTRNPYNFSYFAKRTTTKSPPNYALNGNYLGANSHLSASVANRPAAGQSAVSSGSSSSSSGTSSARTGRYY
ncbi:hypothetical protein ZHAS_00005000 [Anopheles sinensis]|uniref:Uncharacterized protein n=1 Tax=Anopheles sinensis TaxID=74873 RepID=A0A084VIN7_ANOSI|nr:hypothetical protein ZHAS_00005000 [Anopheles sinensis]